MPTSRLDRTAKRRAELVEGLLRPESYPHEVEAPVRLIETHVSHLFLTGRYAYKVKKPVDLGFLDFSTLEKRRSFTLTELDLNRRISPDVYLGVAEVWRSPDGTFLVGPESGGGAETGPAFERVTRGEVEEYALKMRQLRAEQALGSLVGSGLAGPAEIQLLAGFLTAFHGQAKPADPRSPFGGPDLVKKLVTDNLVAVAPWAEPLSIASDVGAVAAYTNGAMDAYAPLIAERKARGWVRDCHGDLHAVNIFIEPSKGGPQVQIIDRIEFNDRYRFIDLASDLAFLTMDLRQLGRPDLAEALMAACSPDALGPSFRRMLRFYEVYRAMVRCKVAVLRVAEQTGGRPRRLRNPPAEVDAARRYATLAARLVAEQRPRALFLMTGVAGSGKSTVARSLASSWGIKHVTSDVVRKTLFGVNPNRPSDPAVRAELYSPRMSFLTYRELIRQGGLELAAGRSVVLDATFLKRDHRNDARGVAARHGVPFVVIECTLDLGKARQRLRQRYEAGTSESDAGPELLDYHLSERQAVMSAECDALVEVDTGGEAQDFIAAAEADIWRQLLGAELR